MATKTKKQKAVLAKYDFAKEYPLEEAIDIIKDISTAKFDSSVDLAFKLGVDPRKADQMVRGTVALPHGTGKKVRVLVLCTPDKESEAKEAGADHVGLDDYLKKIESGWTDIDVIVTMPAVMAKVGKLGKILGPRGLMPNPKTGTVTPDVAGAVKAIKSGRIDFKVDKFGIVHLSIGRVSFSKEKLKDNFVEVINKIVKLKPSSAKGTYLRSASISSTMSKGVFLDKSTITTA